MDQRQGSTSRLNVKASRTGERKARVEIAHEGNDTVIRDIRQSRRRQAIDSAVPCGRTASRLYPASSSSTSSSPLNSSPRDY